MADQEHYKGYARQGRRYVAEHFNQSRRIELLMKVYEEVLAERYCMKG